MELTILMPCLNEEETIEKCINKAKEFLHDNSVDGEVLVVDNGSIDNSVIIAKDTGARVVFAKQKGYGSALIKGCEEARGKYVIMGDADDSYDFLHLMPFLEKLREGYDLVMGNRFAGGIEKNAMPWTHKYIGNPVLSFIGRLFFNSKIHDFHCGLRGYNKERISALSLQTTGMEYASEMVVKSELYGLKITEVPTTLKKDGRSRAPHLRSFRDGWRHLKFLFMYAPNWLFLYPGTILCTLGLGGGIWLCLGEQTIGKTELGIHTMLYCMMSIIVGMNVLLFYVFTKLYAARSHFIPNDIMADKISKVGEDKGILFGFIVIVVGLVLSIKAFILWKETSFGNMVPEILMRIIIPAATMIEIGIEVIFASFFIGILKIKKSMEVGNN